MTDRRRISSGRPQALILQLDGERLEYTFVRDRHRTLRLTVKPDGEVSVRAPASMSMDLVQAFLRSRLGWIQQKRTFFLEHKGRETVFRDGGTIWCLGEARIIKAVPMRRGLKARLDGAFLELPCRPPAGWEGPCPENLLKRAFLIWRHAFASEYLPLRLAELDGRARRILGDGSAFSSLCVRSLKRRWGSCSARGEICLASALIALPEELIDFVILHELCHLRQMDHGTAFHALLRKLAPDEKMLDKKLRVWGLEHPRI